MIVATVVVFILFHCYTIKFQQTRPIVVGTDNKLAILNHKDKKIIIIIAIVVKISSTFVSVT